MNLLILRNTRSKNEYQDQESFLSKTHPFEVLTPSQIATCIEHMDIAYYPKDTVLISPEKIPKYFLLLSKVQFLNTLLKMS